MDPWTNAGSSSHQRLGPLFNTRDLILLSSNSKICQALLTNLTSAKALISFWTSQQAKLEQKDLQINYRPRQIRLSKVVPMTYTQEIA